MFSFISEEWIEKENEDEKMIPNKMTISGPAFFFYWE